MHNKRKEDHIAEDERTIQERMHTTFGKKNEYYRRDVEESDTDRTAKRVKMAYNGLNKYKNITEV